MGGTFDPIHHGHLIVAEEVRFLLGLNKIIFIPSGDPPHKLGRVQTAIQHRLKMVQLAIATNPNFSISHVEIDRPGPSYLVDTLSILREQWGPQAELNFIMGWDSLEDFPGWHNPAGILAQLARLVVVHRPGYVENEEYNKQLEARLPGITRRLCVLEVPQLDISSTDIRRRIAEQRPIKYKLPELVEQYIVDHQLYQPTIREKES